MRIELASVYVSDQAEALAFYTDILGELLLEPAGHPAVGPYRAALIADGLPAIQLAVDDVAAEHERLEAAGVRFTQEPTDIGEAVIAVFDDTCGNLIQIVAEKS